MENLLCSQKLARLPMLSMFASFLFIPEIYFMNTHALLKSKAHQESGLRPIWHLSTWLKRDVVSAVNRWRNHCDGPKKEIFGWCCLQYITLITPCETDWKDHDCMRWLLQAQPIMGSNNYSDLPPAPLLPPDWPVFAVQFQEGNARLCVRTMTWSPVHG